MKKSTFLSFMALFLMTAMSFAQGVTTSSITGRVLDNTETPLPGANIVAVHVPTGSVYGAITDFDGFYRITNMRSGGPYNLTISYVGFEDYTNNGFNLSLGEAKRVSATLEESQNALDEIVITTQSNGVFNSNKTGTETAISERDINTLPAVSRSIADFARVTPQAQLTEGNDGFSISLAGQNNRYNAVYIDGAVNNDVFGLAGSGTNGGQTGVNPLSVDAIESFQINIAPFDVRQSGFSGGSINAVTRSGSNNWIGSAYGFLRNESFAGKTPVDLVDEEAGESREKLDEFSALTYGVRLGGPLVKDKLFFFVNYERQEDETPQPFNFSNYQGNSSIDDINNLASFLQSEYGYNPGIFNANTRTLDSDKFNIRLDWNINENHKVSLRQGIVEAENLEARGSGNRSIGFINGSEFFVTKTYSTAFELNSTFGSKFANNLKIGYTSVSDDRDPLGNPFPTVDIQDGAGTISFGAEPFSTANLLEQDIFTINNNFEIFSGRHAVTIGTNLEWASAKNLFFAFNFGDYTFEDQFDDDGNLLSSGLNQFLTGAEADVYQHGYSLVGDGTVGDGSAGSADFQTFQAGFYVQDEVQVSENFKLTGGIRVDIPYWEDGTVNNDFNNRTIPLLEAAGKDLQRARVGQGINASAHFAPRLGFNWDVFDNNTTQVRGGLGVFTSRLPLVWPGGTYNNNGVTGGFMFIFGQEFEADVNNQFEDPAPGSGGVGGNIDLFAKNFRLPQVAKYNLSVDQKLPFWGLIATVDLLYTDVLQDVYYENLNLRGPVGTLNGADNRPVWDRRDEIDDTYGRIILASNTSEGYSYNGTLTLRKPLSNGFQGQVSYTYGESEKIFDGTSSQNGSQWRNNITRNGKNSNLPLSRSDFSLGSRFNANVSYEIEYGGDFGGKTTVGLFYEGAQGTPYSYTYREGRDLLNDDSRDNALIYVPANASEIQFSGDASEQIRQWELLNFYIENDDYLKSRRGQYAERNASRGPWNHIVDLKFLQDFYIKTGDKKNTLQVSVDVFNFTNLLNKDWGVRKFIGSEVSPLQTVSTSDNNPVFSFVENLLEYDEAGNPIALDVEQIDDQGLQSARWQMQLGLRYIFN
ncbi:MAG: carboxypeptidase regulatory-like domain-containing protein [Dokdonia sp.]|jgi:outer membrane receptor for ferrienterochelin and colicin|nr:TonB-dependent receptor [Cytophagaceae bacterium]